jgi:hypothetical protein
VARLRNYKEGQSFNAVFKFYDENYVPSSPLTARYRIDCLTTGQAIRDWTTFNPGQSVTIAVTPNDNRIINTRNPSERRQMVVQSNYGTDTQSVQSTDWIVENLQGVV